VRRGGSRRSGRRRRARAPRSGLGGAHVPRGSTRPARRVALTGPGRSRAGLFSRRARRAWGSGSGSPATGIGRAGSGRERPSRDGRPSKGSLPVSPTARSALRPGLTDMLGRLERHPQRPRRPSLPVPGQALAQKARRRDRFDAGPPPRHELGSIGRELPALGPLAPFVPVRPGTAFARRSARPGGGTRRMRYLRRPTAEIVEVRSPGGTAGSPRAPARPRTRARPSERSRRKTLARRRRTPPEESRLF